MWSGLVKEPKWAKRSSTGVYYRIWNELLITSPETGRLELREATLEIGLAWKQNGTNADISGTSLKRNL